MSTLPNDNPQVSRISGVPALSSLANTNIPLGGGGIPPPPPVSNRGLPTVANLSNPDLTSVTPGTQTNMAVNVPIMCRPWSMGFQNKYAEGDILFVHIGAEHSSSMKRVANLPVLNYCLTTVRNDEGKEEKGGPAARQKLSNLANWRFFGVLTSIMDTGNQQRLFGVTVQGRASVKNYWANEKKLSPMDKLYLGYKAPEVSYAINGGGQEFNGGDQEIDGAIPEHVLPLPLGEGVERQLCVGFVGIRPHHHNIPKAVVDKAAMVQECTNKLKRIEIFLRR